MTIKKNEMVVGSMLMQFIPLVNLWSWLEHKVATIAYNKNLKQKAKQNLKQRARRAIDQAITPRRT